MTRMPTGRDSVCSQVRRHRRRRLGPRLFRPSRRARVDGRGPTDLRSSCCSHFLADVGPPYDRRSDGGRAPVYGRSGGPIGAPACPRFDRRHTNPPDDVSHPGSGANSVRCRERLPHQTRAPPGSARLAPGSNHGSRPLSRDPASQSAGQPQQPAEAPLVLDTTMLASCSVSPFLTYHSQRLPSGAWTQVSVFSA